jgi:hypothetical protein
MVELMANKDEQPELNPGCVDGRNGPEICEKWRGLSNLDPSLRTNFNRWGWYYSAVRIIGEHNTSFQQSA